MLGVNCVKTGQHSKAVCPGSFKPATEVHLSLLLFLQRGPPRFNWVLMESKSPLSLQPLELDRLIPPQKSFFFFFFFTRPYEKQPFSAKWPWKPTGESGWAVGAGRHPLEPRTMAKERNTWGVTFTWLRSQRHGRSFFESHRLPVQPGQLSGGIIPNGPHLHFNW